METVSQYHKVGIAARNTLQYICTLKKVLVYKSGGQTPAFYFISAFKKGVLTLSYYLILDYLSKKIYMTQVTSSLQNENDTLKRKNKRLLMGVGTLSLTTIIAIILWLLGINLNPKPFYEVPIDPATFNLKDSIDSFRTKMAPNTKTHLIMYNAKSIYDYHKDEFQNIIDNSGIGPLSNANYSWQTVFYLMIKDGRMALAVLPTIVEKDISGSNVINVFDYFDPANFANSALYNSKALTAYDFGHLEP